jgi:hypothetical protein
MSADEIFYVLTNGEWHERVQVEKRIPLSPEKLDVLLRFLSEFNFIELDTEGKRMRLTQPASKWLIEIQ